MRSNAVRIVSHIHMDPENLALKLFQHYLIHEDTFDEICEINEIRKKKALRIFGALLQGVQRSSRNYPKIIACFQEILPQMITDLGIYKIVITLTEDTHVLCAIQSQVKGSYWNEAKKKLVMNRVDMKELSVSLIIHNPHLNALAEQNTEIQRLYMEITRVLGSKDWYILEDVIRLGHCVDLPDFDISRLMNGFVVVVDSLINKLSVFPEYYSKFFARISVS